MRLEEGLVGGLLFLRGEPRRYHFRGHGSRLEDGGSQGSSHGRMAKHSCKSWPRPFMLSCTCLCQIWIDLEKDSDWNLFIRKFFVLCFWSEHYTYFLLLWCGQIFWHMQVWLHWIILTLYLLSSSSNLDVVYSNHFLPVGRLSNSFFVCKADFRVLLVTMNALNTNLSTESSLQDRNVSCRYLVLFGGEQINILRNMNGFWWIWTVFPTSDMVWCAWNVCILEPYSACQVWNILLYISPPHWEVTRIPTHFYGNICSVSGPWTSAPATANLVKSCLQISRMRFLRIVIVMNTWQMRILPVDSCLKALTCMINWIVRVATVSTVIPTTVVVFWNPKKYQLLSLTLNRNCTESDIRHPTSADGFHKPAMNHCFFSCSLRGFVSQLWLPLSRRYQGVAQGLQWYHGACSTGTLLQIPPAFWSGEPKLSPRNWTWDKSSQTFRTPHARKSNSRNPDA